MAAKLSQESVSPRWKRFEGDTDAANRLADQEGEPRTRFPEDPIHPKNPVSELERQVVADELEAFALESKAGRVGCDEAYRFLRASMWVLSHTEMERVMLGLVNLLRAKS